MLLLSFGSRPERERRVLQLPSTGIHYNGNGPGDSKLGEVPHRIEVVGDLLLEEVEVPGGQVRLAARNRQPPQRGPVRVEVPPDLRHSPHQLLRAVPHRLEMAGQARPPRTGSLRKDVAAPALADVRDDLLDRPG